MTQSETEEPDHAVKVVSLQEFRTTLYPENIDAEGNVPELHQKMDCHIERKLTFECACGKRFRKWETAANHLHNLD